MSNETLKYKEIGKVTASIDNQNKTLVVNDIDKYQTIVKVDNIYKVYGKPITLSAKVLDINNTPVNIGQVLFKINNKEVGYAINPTDDGVFSLDIIDVAKYFEQIYNIEARYIENRYYQTSIGTGKLTITKLNMNISINEVKLSNDTLIINSKPNQLVELNANINLYYMGDTKYNSDDIISNNSLKFIIDNNEYQVIIKDNKAQCNFVTNDIGNEIATQIKTMNIGIKFEETLQYHACNQITYNDKQYDSIKVIIDPIDTNIKIKDIYSKYGQPTYISADIIDEYARDVKFGQVEYKIQDYNDDGEVILTLNGNGAVSNGYVYFIESITNNISNNETVIMGEYPNKIQTKTVLTLPSSNVTVGDKGVTVEYEAQVFNDDNTPITNGIVVFTMDDVPISSVEVNNDGKVYASNILTYKGTHKIQAHYKGMFEYQTSDSDIQNLIVG